MRPACREKTRDEAVQLLCRQAQKMQNFIDVCQDSKTLGRVTLALIIIDCCVCWRSPYEDVLVGLCIRRWDLRSSNCRYSDEHAVPSYNTTEVLLFLIITSLLQEYLRREGCKRGKPMQVAHPATISSVDLTPAVLEDATEGFTPPHPTTTLNCYNFSTILLRGSRR